MQHSVKMLVNTIASYLRIIANGIVSIIVTRIALNALGVYDFGLYNLMAGTIALLSFVNTALLISSQRYFSIALGKKDNLLLQRYFSSSLVIHGFLSVIMIIVLLSLQPVLFNYVLNINPDQLKVAKIIYQIMILSTCITMLCVPFAAMMNAFEDIAALSYINIGSYIIRLLAALSLLYFKSHLLIIFSVIIFLSICFKFIVEMIWCRCKYSIISFSLRKYFNRYTCNEMIGFSSWNTIGSFSVLIRDEGVAIMLNSFFGTAINAAYGIANQVNSLVLSFASNLTTVFAPSIMQAKGAEDNVRMRYLAIFSSKISLMLSSTMGLPILLLLEPILNIWLKEVPPYTIAFCRFIICCFLIQQTYPGINRMIYATGNIKYYQLGIFIIFTSIIPVGILLFHLGYSPTCIFYVMISSQIAAMVWTLYIAKKLCSIKIIPILFQSVLIPIAIFVSLYYISEMILNKYIIPHSIYTIIGVFLVILVIYVGLTFWLVLNNQERGFIINFMKACINNRLK